MIALWVTLFVSSEVGIGCAVGFNIVYVLLRQVFTRLSTTGGGVQTGSELAHSLNEARSIPQNLPEDTRIFRFNESLFFPNAFSNTSAALDDIQTFHSPVYNGSHGPETERNWSVVTEKRVARLRKKAGIHDPSTLPAIGLVVLDFSRVNHIDSTAVTHLKNLAASVKKYGGKEVEIRFVGLSPYVRERFERAEWRIIETGDDDESEEDNYPTVLYRDLASAVRAPRRAESMTSESGLKAHTEHYEKAEA